MFSIFSGGNIQRASEFNKILFELVEAAAAAAVDDDDDGGGGVTVLDVVESVGVAATTGNAAFEFVLFA